MSQPSEYVLGSSAEAARRLEIQDRHFAEASEQLLDFLKLRPTDRVVELGCGPGMFSRRILKRLGAGGTLVAVDSAPGLLEQAKAMLGNTAPVKYQPTLADAAQLGDWLDGADVVCGRAVLHHIPMAEFTIGRLRGRVRPGTRLGFMEPDFRAPLARVAHLEAAGHEELEPLRVWATVINELYLIRRISPCVGATLATAFTDAGCCNVQAAYAEFPCNDLVIDNMIMFYDEVGATLEKLGIITRAECARQQGLLKQVPLGAPAVWGVHLVSCEA
ncbi:MAG TPA: methyltransferase [Gemmataceae bacterium]|jgi:ubiquinone/menaquinone biosynthesis C-methylase UbiE